MDWVMMAVVVAAGVITGVHEGMVHVQHGDRMEKDVRLLLCGVRMHRWYGVYHVLAMGMRGALVAVGAVAAVWWRPEDTQHAVAVVLACGAAAWEACEVGYAVGRYGRPWASVNGHVYEHVTILDVKWLTWDVYGWDVVVVHAARIAVAVVMFAGRGWV